MGIPMLADSRGQFTGSASFLLVQSRGLPARGTKTPMFRRCWRLWGSRASASGAASRGFFSRGSIRSDVHLAG